MNTLSLRTTPKELVTQTVFSVCACAFRLVGGLLPEAHCGEWCEMKEEVFGPLTCVVPFKTEEEVLLCN